ncbi:MAG TPA: Ku protein, partial [Polyangiaceae bacterium]|nr:Ku protein [Polyangiaceae bacterium]
MSNVSLTWRSCSCRRTRPRPAVRFAASTRDGGVWPLARAGSSTASARAGISEGKLTSVCRPRPCGKRRLVARPIWSGAISFGLVSVPVRMFTATSSQELRFHFLDRRDLQPIGYDKVNRETGESVPAEEIVRGFEVEQGRFVEVTEEDIDRLDVELTHAIDICDFV